MDTLGVLTVGEKQLMLRSLKRAGVTGQFALIYSIYIHASRHRQCAFRLRRLAESGGRRWVLLATALSLWRHAHLGTSWWRKGTSCFGAPKSTESDRCKGLDLLCFEMQFSWQVQHFGLVNLEVQ